MAGIISVDFRFEEKNESFHSCFANPKSLKFKF